MGGRALKLAEISWSVIQPRFERALHRRLIGRKEISPFDLADKIGVHVKTVEGWLYAGTEPKASAMRRLELWFGPEFADEVFGGFDVVEARAAISLALADVAGIRDACSELVDRLNATLAGKGGAVVQFREGA